MGETALWLISGPRHELSVFAQFGFLVFGIEQFLFDWIWLGREGWRAATVYRRHDRATMASLMPPRAPGCFAILIGAWDESAVIATTLTTALDRWGDADYRIYVAVYPNDPATVAEIERVRTMRAAADRIRIVPGDRPGPVTKAEALNRAWVALCADEQALGLRYKAAILHDAEDYVSPYELRLFDTLIERFALVQIPVRPLKRSGLAGVAGHYLDEFADTHWPITSHRKIRATLVARGRLCESGHEAAVVNGRESLGMPYPFPRRLPRKGALMPYNARRTGHPSVQSRGARPTPTYNDDVSEGYVHRQNNRIEAERPANFELTPVSGDAW